MVTSRIEQNNDEIMSKFQPVRYIIPRREHDKSTFKLWNADILINSDEI